MNKNNDIHPSFLTKSEYDYLLGNNNEISKSYQYKMKSSIRRKWQDFLDLELPLIQKSGLISEDLTVFSKDLTTYCKAGNSINYSNAENCAQNRSLGRDLDPGPLPYQGNALPG